MNFKRDYDLPPVTTRFVVKPLDSQILITITLQRWLESDDYEFYGLVNQRKFMKSHFLLWAPRV